jgi:putative transposase
LRRDHPDAAGSLLEGLEEMFTVARLGITGALRRSWTNTNCIESMISTVRTFTGRVKNWQDGDMKKRWIATGMIEAQRSFRRVRGHTQMTNLVELIGHTINPVTPDNYDQAVA